MFFYSYMPEGNIKTEKLPCRSAINSVTVRGEQKVSFLVVVGILTIIVYNTT